MLDLFLVEKFKLTGREIQVLKLVVKGYTNREIADILKISFHTSKAHISSLLAKFKVDRREKLAVLAIKECMANNLEI